ncbi:15207_t:CDS:2 [Funneliformis mosseae]|uniref:15207_t:CDS:1 n=1 Tax=Funneliformis mosseae TaxID=27381 RepID=A0A9N9HWT2_FUNMO|nr:15207_t:CDS:2 [Funneliformis mosseae]
MGFLDCELAKKLPPNQLVCCNNSNDPSSSCSTDFSNCFEPKELIKCYKIDNLEACRRTDDVAKTVCQNKDSLYCLWDRGGTSQRLLSKYPLFSKVIIWQFSRNTEAESRSRTRAKYNETTQNYETWINEDNDSGGSARKEESVAEVFCSDLFQPQIDCMWVPRLYSNITVLNSVRPTKLSNLATVISTPIGIIIGILGLFTTLRCFKRRKAEANFGSKGIVKPEDVEKVEEN